VLCCGETFDVGATRAAAKTAPPITTNTITGTLSIMNKSRKAGGCACCRCQGTTAVAGHCAA
jgi:hypothetical protein